jgi:hypothetical protein
MTDDFLTEEYAKYCKTTDDPMEYDDWYVGTDYLHKDENDGEEVMQLKIRKKYRNIIRYFESGIWKEKKAETYESAKWFCRFYEEKHGFLSCRIRREEV